MIFAAFADRGYINRRVRGKATTETLHVSADLTNKVGDMCDGVLGPYCRSLFFPT